MSLSPNRTELFPVCRKQVASVLQLPALGLNGDSVWAMAKVAVKNETDSSSDFMFRISWVWGELSIRQPRKLWTGINENAGNLYREGKILALGCAVIDDRDSGLGTNANDRGSHAP